MNARIKEFAEESGFMMSWFSESGDDCETELKKFAAFIINDCITAIQADAKNFPQVDLAWVGGMNEAAHVLSKRFGVKE